jgi:hypothetical protein
MQWVLLFLLPAVAFAALGWFLRGVLPSWASRLRRRKAPPVPDPFAVLHLQRRLGRVADQVRLLECDREVYAKAQRLTATRAAYDDLLAEACRLAGVEIDPGAARGEDERLREEMELASRGWSW